MVLVIFLSLICGTLVLNCIVIALLFLSKLEIDVNKLKIGNELKEKNNKKFTITLSLKICELIWFKIKINTDKLSKIYAKEKIKMQKDNITFNKIRKNFNNDIIKNKNVLEEIKKTRINLKQLSLEAKIGTEDYVVTAYLVAIISILISNTLPRLVKIRHYKNKSLRNEIYYKINPMYISKNLYEVKLNCIIETKLVHIIYIIFLIIKEKRRSDKNERTSNRKPYEYSYE